MKRWIGRLRDVGESPDVDRFLADIEAVCRKHNLSLSHEDSHGAFCVEALSESNIEWLQQAQDARKGA